MWKDLPKEQKEEYKKMICVFCSLSSLFSQKSINTEKVTEPYINSKYQETIFSKVFNATIEDIGNTSYDASLTIEKDGQKTNYLVGIKSFQFKNGAQKIAQFKHQNIDWADKISKIEKAKKNIKEINKLNHSIYKELAKRISELRNQRLRSSQANLKGFNYSNETDIKAVYHVLMPAVKDSQAVVYVGETDYSLIDINNIKITGCYTNRNPYNFGFTDGKHQYKFTVADSQLYMIFDNANIIQEAWNIDYVEDAYAVFAKLANINKQVPDYELSSFKTQKTEVTEYYIWSLMEDHALNRYSGFNAFNSVGSRLTKEQRIELRKRLLKKYKDLLSNEKVVSVIDSTCKFILTEAKTDEQRFKKEQFRTQIINVLNEITDVDVEFKEEILKLLFRPITEMYIPIPDSYNFHQQHPNFFVKNIFHFNAKKNFTTSVEKRSFDLVFEPSGEKIKAYIGQQAGKSIMSVESMQHLGNWILKGIFQLKDYEVLTKDKLEEIGINSIVLYRTKSDNDVHLQFIYVE